MSWFYENREDEVVRESWRNLFIIQKERESRRNLFIIQINFLSKKKVKVGGIFRCPQKVREVGVFFSKKVIVFFNIHYPANERFHDFNMNNGVILLAIMMLIL